MRRCSRRRWQLRWKASWRGNDCAQRLPLPLPLRPRDPPQPRGHPPGSAAIAPTRRIRNDPLDGVRRVGLEDRRGMDAHRGTPDGSKLPAVLGQGEEGCGEEGMGEESGSGGQGGEVLGVEGKSMNDETKNEPKSGSVVIIRYTNHRGETANRRIVPIGIRFGSTEWHPEQQWLLEAFDLDRDATRSFAMRDILEWAQREKQGPSGDGAVPADTHRVGGHHGISSADWQGSSKAESNRESGSGENAKDNLPTMPSQRCAEESAKNGGMADSSSVPLLQVREVTSEPHGENCQCPECYLP
jgi:hypothetical protein